jgi:hypothetical protein
MKILFFSAFLVLVGLEVAAQSTVITPTSLMANTSIKPIVLPRLSALSIWAIPNPKKGTMVYDLTNNILRAFDGTKWVRYKSFGTDITPNTPLSTYKENELVQPLNPQTPLKP